MSNASWYWYNRLYSYVGDSTKTRTLAVVMPLKRRDCVHHGFKPWRSASPAILWSASHYF